MNNPEISQDPAPACCAAAFGAREKLAGLRAELAELAFALECRGRRDAADVAMTIAARVEEISEELATGSTGVDSPPNPAGRCPE